VRWAQRLSTPPAEATECCWSRTRQSISEPFSNAPWTREGFRADGRRDAWRQARDGDRPSSEPDIVLLDLMLPDGDGRESAARCRRLQQVPIIMLTARGTEVDRIVGLEIGADDYVVKPFAAAEVIARIRAVLRRTRQRDAAASTA
jgi:DNA-binding response OmpR family regulator